MDGGSIIKRCKNAYILYTIKRRKELSELYPHLSNIELVKKIAFEWRNLPFEEKEVYKQKELKDREEFNLSKSNLNTNIKYKTRILKRPLRFRTPFMFYLQDNKGVLSKEKNSTTNVDKLREIGAKWKSMSLVDKKNYIEKAKKDKERYNEEFEFYIKTNLLQTKNSKKKKHKKIEKMIQNVNTKCKDVKYLQKLNEQYSKIKRSYQIKHLKEDINNDINSNKNVFKVEKVEDAKSKIKVEDTMNYNSNNYNHFSSDYVDDYTSEKKEDEEHTINLLKDDNNDIDFNFYNIYNNY